MIRVAEEYEKSCDTCHWFDRDGERKWKREGELYKTFMQKFYKAFGK